MSKNVCSESNASVQRCPRHVRFDSDKPAFHLALLRLSDRLLFSIGLGACGRVTASDAAGIIIVLFYPCSIIVARRVREGNADRRERAAQYSSPSPAFRSESRGPRFYALQCANPSGGAMAVPVTRYAKSGDVHIAYQVFGSGPIDLVFVPGFVSHIENSMPSRRARRREVR